MRTASIALTALALAGCATAAKFSARMDSLVGVPESMVVGMYGPPMSSYALSDGSKVIQYRRGGQMLLPGATTYQPVRASTTGNVTMNQGLSQATGTYRQTTTTYVPQTSPSTAVDLYCTLNLIISPAGRVASWSAQGNHCVSE